CVKFNNASQKETANALLEEHKQLLDIVDRLIELEKEDINIKLPERKLHFDAFVDWCQTNAIDCKNVEIFEVDCDEYGLRSKINLQENDLILNIPRKALISTETALIDTNLAEFAKNDPILKSMPNVLLSLHIIDEYCKANSFWKPYLSICPSTYTTPLYYTHEEMQMLKGSVALEEAVKLCRSIYRQYAYFWKKLHSPSTSASKLSLRNHFTFSLYR
ncbi:histone-lysine N-methyltransferase setd3-like protein, partial [Dinothrombium tinctorium]